MFTSSKMILFCLAAFAYATDPFPLKTAVDKDLECAVRKLALEFARKIQPFRDIQSTFDALQLKEMCGIPPPTRLEKKFPSIYTEDSNVFYMAVDGSGSDCSQASPCNDFDALLAKTRQLSADVPKTVYLNAGVYFLKKTLELTDADSNLTFANVPGEEVWISGGIPLEAKWEKSSFNDKIFVSSVPDSVVNITGLFTLGEKHTRLVRARYPNGNVEIYNSPNHNIRSNQVKSWWKPEPYPKDNWPKQIFKDLACSSGQTPCKDDSTMPTYNQYGNGIGGPCDLWSPSESYWCSNISAGGWAFEDQRMATQGQRQLPIGMTYLKENLPNFSKWTHASPDSPEYILHGWHDQTWFSNMWEITKHDMNEGTFAFGNGGFQGGRNWHTNMSGGPELISGPWYVENVLEELDSPGEWYFDRAARKIYMWPNGSLSDSFVATNLQTLISIKGSSMNSPIKDINFFGLNFRDAAYTYLGDQNGGWGVPSGGDWSLWRGGALFLENTERVNISECAFIRLDGNAVFLSNYNRNATVRRSEFAFIGDNALAGWGTTNEYDGTTGDQPRFTTIEENLVHELGLYEKQSSMWFQAKTCQTTLRKNVFFNGPRAAINFNDGFGGGNLVSQNLIFNTCRESGDHGPINSWDRQPFMTKVGNGKPSFAPALTTTTGNFILANYGGSQAFDNDDGSSFYDTYSNFFWSADGFKMDYGGHDSLFHENVIATLPYDSQNCYNVAGFKDGHGDTMFGNHCMILGCRTVECEDLIVSAAQCYKGMPSKFYKNFYYTKHGNATYKCGGQHFKSLPELQKLDIEVGSVATTLPTNEKIISLARDVLGL